MQTYWKKIIKKNKLDGDAGNIIWSKLCASREIGRRISWGRLDQGTGNRTEMNRLCNRNANLNISETENVIFRLISIPVLFGRNPYIRISGVVSFSICVTDTRVIHLYHESLNLACRIFTLICIADASDRILLHSLAVHRNLRVLGSKNIFIVLVCECTL